MKNARVVAIACTFFLVSAVGFAQAPTKAPLTREAIAAILGLSTAGGGCAKAPAAGPSQMVFASKKEGPGGGVGEMAFCQANCESGTVQCTGDISCQAFHRNCTTACEPGHVTCNDTVNGTTTTWCPTQCSGGTSCCNCAQTGDCVDCCRCDGGSLMQCNNCCACQETSDCFACCRCEGGSIGQCGLQCG
jgi:hypothetical protein